MQLYCTFEIVHVRCVTQFIIETVVASSTKFFTSCLFLFIFNTLQPAKTQRRDDEARESNEQCEVALVSMLMPLFPP